VRVADDGSTVIFSPLTGKGQEPEDIVHHREASLAAEREAHEATATKRAQARQAQWQAADDAEVSRLQDLAYEGAKASQAAAKKREAREAKRLEQALAGLQAEVDDPEWSLNELEEASGVVLFGPNGPMQPVLPGSMRGLHDSLASTFSELRASSGREGLSGDAAPPTDTAVTQDSSEPAGLQSRSALDAGQDEHAPLQPGSRAIAPGLLQQLGTSVSLEQLPTDMLPGPGEVNPFSPLGKALKSVAETGVVNSHKLGGGSLKSGQSAASRPYLAMATLNAGKDWLGSQGPAPAARRLLQPEQFDEVLESMGAAHDLYMFEQAGLEYQRLVSAENAIDYDSPAIAIQRCWRGVLGRRYAFHRRVLSNMKQVATLAVCSMQRVARGFLGRCKARRLRAARVRMMLLHHNVRLIQRCFRQYLDRCATVAAQWQAAVLTCQRVTRGHIGRRKAAAERHRQRQRMRQVAGATGVQALWRGYWTRHRVEELKIWVIAATAVQRWFRGRVGRRLAANQKAFVTTAPGPSRLKIGLDSVNYWYGRLESLKAKLTAAKRKEASLVGKRAVVTKRKATFERELEQLQRQRREIGRLDEEIDELVGDRESLVDLLRESKSRGASRRSTRSAASALSGEAARLGVGLPPALQRIADAAQASQVQQTSSTGKARTLEEAHTVQLALNLKKAEKHRRTLELEQDELELTRKIDGTKADLERIGKEIKSLQLRQRQLTRSKAAISGEVTTLVLRQSRELHDMKQRQLLPQMLAAREEAKRLESAASAAIKRTVAHKVDTAMTQTRDTVQGLVLKAAAQYMPAAATVHALAASAAGESSLSRRMRQESMQHSFFTGAAIMLSKEDNRLIAARAASAKKEKLRIKKAEVLQALAESAKIRSFAPSLRLWTVEDVCRWLDTMGMAEYQQAARDADLDGDTLADLSREDIGYALNIRSMVHLNRIAQAAAAIQRGVDVAKASRVHVKPQPDPTEQRKVLAEVAAAEGKALQGGFDPNARDAAGNTALHYAATNLNLRIIGILLQYGAEINAQNGIGNTPLHNAVDADPSGDLPKALMGRGADPTLRNTDAREAKDGALGAPVIE
ncbi:HOS4, partial [Symbiodinium sp. KB8]